jgi:vitamin B12 transporter
MYKIILLLTLLGSSLFAQDTLSFDLSEIKVSANIVPYEIRKTARNVSIIEAADIQNSPVKTIDGILQYALNIDVRSRSPFGVQSDISIRGGHFDQTLIMIDGVKMNDPQTGHHSMNLPLPIEQIERIEVLQGGASRVYGPSAFSGVINFITKKSAIGANSVSVTGGQHKLYELKGNVGINRKNNNTLLSVSKMHSDGYAYNTAFDRFTAYGNSVFNQTKGTFSIQAGLVSNKFGASNFYHPKFYDQYEETDAKYIALTKLHNFSNKLSGTLIGSFRKHNDVYDFNKYLSNNIGSVNFHQSNVFDIDYKMRYLSKFGASSIGIEWRQEGVISNRLGDSVDNPKAVKNYPEIVYSKSKIRQNLSSYLEHQIQKEKWFISGGALLNFNSQFGSSLYPGVDISFFPTKTLTVYSTVNKSLRFPTFTEMYLNTSTVKADPNLLPEKAVNYEVGLKSFTNLFNLTTSIFYRQTTDAIDKVKRPELTTPTMENIDNINMMGFEILGQFNISKRLNNPEHWFQKINMNYSFLNANRKEDGFQSFYTLNYLSHKLSTGTFFRISDNISASANYTFKKREGSFQWDAASPIQFYKPVHLLDLRISYAKNRFTAFLDANNLLNYQYVEFGFVEQPGRWLSTGVKMSF